MLPGGCGGGVHCVVRRRMIHEKKRLIDRRTQQYILSGALEVVMGWRVEGAGVAGVDCTKIGDMFKVILATVKFSFQELKNSNDSDQGNMKYWQIE